MFSKKKDNYSILIFKLPGIRANAAQKSAIKAWEQNTANKCVIQGKSDIQGILILIEMDISPLHSQLPWVEYKIRHISFRREMIQWWQT